jgi:hypothetical protein
MSHTGANVSGFLFTVLSLSQSPSSVSLSLVVIMIMCWSVSLRYIDRIVHSSALFSSYVILRMQNNFLLGTV